MPKSCVKDGVQCEQRFPASQQRLSWKTLDGQTSRDDNGRLLANIYIETSEGILWVHPFILHHGHRLVHKLHDEKSY